MHLQVTSGSNHTQTIMVKKKKKKHTSHDGGSQISTLAGMSLKVATMLGRRGVQHEFTEGTLCWMFISGLSVEIAACSRRLS